MKNVYDYLIRHSIQAIFATLTGVTLVTSAVGVVKVAGSVNSYKPKVPEIKTVQEALQEDSNLSKPSPSPTVTKTKTNIAVTVSPSPTAIPIQPTNAPNEQADAKPGLTSEGDIEIKNNYNHDRLEVDDDLEDTHKDNQ